MKKVLMFLSVLITFFMFKTNVFAGSYTVSTSSSYVLVGNKVTVYVNVSGLAGQFKVTSSNSSVLSGGSSSIWLDNESKSFTFTAKAAGTATITVTPVNVANYADNSAYTTVKSLKITVSVPSSNNYLASLKVGDYPLSPAFDKEKLEYDVEVPNDVRKVTIEATKYNSMASVKGTCEGELNEGVNPFEITVTAQSGSVKTYKLNIIVKELAPIEVTVNGNKYNVVRKKEQLPAVNP